MKIYVASSWRNPTQPDVVRRLRELGFDPYDFRNPAPGDEGFSWRDVEAELEPGIPPKGSDLVPVNRYLRMLAHPAAAVGFERDFEAMAAADAFVLVLPCGRSAHLELGWAVGRGIPTAILLEDPAEPELMYRMVSKLAVGLEELELWLRDLEDDRRRTRENLARALAPAPRGTGLYGGLRR